MQCPRCNKDNPNDSQFCNGCGAPIMTYPAQQPMNADRKSALKLLAGIGAAILFVGFLWSIAGIPRRPPSSDTPSRSSSSSPSTSANATWHELISFKGNGAKQTDTFAVRSDVWRVVWDTKPGKYGDMNFQIFVYNADGSMLGLAANVIGKDADSSVFRGRGDYYLQINTSQPYVINVEVKY